MKVIKLGCLADETSHRHSCQHCGTIFEFQRKEAEYINDQRDGDCLKIDCPGCRRPAYASVSVTTYDGPG